MFPTTIFLGDLLIVTVVMLAGFILPASARFQIILFQVLSGVLVMLTLWTIVISGNGWSILLTMIPIGFAVFVTPLANYILDPAPIAPLSIWQRITTLLLSQRKYPYSTVLAPLSIWQRIIYALLGLSLIALIFAVTPYLSTLGSESSSLSLPAALVLVLVGICTWLVRRDLISQAIGLLVMDDGLFLLSESVVHRTELTAMLLIVLFLYLLVPFTCLLLVMPRLGQTTLKLDADQFQKLRG